MLTGLCITVKPQLIIDGRKAAFDIDRHLWIATLPEERFGSDCTLSVSLEEGWSMPIIHRDTVDTHYTFRRITGRRPYPITIKNEQGFTIAGVIMFTFLPILQLQTDAGLDYVDNRLLLSDPQRSTTDSYNIQARWRGNTTNGPGKHKHNYRLKLPYNVSLLGMRKDNIWILDAGQIDLFRFRNRVATDLWNDFATRPYYADKEPEACSGTRGKAVELFIGQHYWGVYNFSEYIDRKQMRLMKKTEYDGEVHGALWKSDGYSIATMYWNDNTPPTDPKSERWDTFEAKYPDLSDSDTIDWQTLHDAIWFVSHSSNTEFTREISTYFDIPVLVDYFLFYNVLLALDNSAKNMVWAVYDKQTDRRLTPAVWDLDCTAGQRWVERFNPRYSSPTYPLFTGTQLDARLLRLNAADFRRKAYERYWQLRETFFSTESLIKRYTDCYDMLKNSGAALREQDRWSGDSDIDGDTINFNDELAYIKKWLSQRMSYLDRAMKANSFLVNIETIDTSDHENSHAATYSLTGQKMPDSQQLLKPGIYIRNGRKIMVR